MPRATEADANTPVSRRIPASELRFQASAQPIDARPASAMVIVTTRSLPKRSPSGPCSSTATAYARAKEVMMTEAAETLVSKSAASLGSIGSTQRSEMPALNAASASSRIASRDCAAFLGSESLDSPATCGAPVEEPVVQPVGPALPELDYLRNDAVAAPVGRSRRLGAMALARLLHGLFQRFARRHGFALRRGPGREARAERAGGEILVRFGAAHFFHAALDAHLALDLRPQEYETGGGARFELAPLAAEVIGVEHETAAFDAFQEHDSC